METRGGFLARVLVLVASAGAAACGGTKLGSTQPESFASRFDQFKPAAEPNGDLAKVVWPKFVADAGPEVKQLYEFQVTHGELMRYMPCFCGCGDFAGHRSNRDCYIRRVNRDGSVVFDDMAPT